MIDKATTEMPDVRQMGLADAKQVAIEWIRSTWDFNKKSEAHIRDIQRATSVKRIQQQIMGAAASGLLMKSFSLKS